MKQTILSEKQSTLLENLIVHHGQVVTSRQILDQAEGMWDAQQASNRVTQMVKNGWLVRIKRGLYTISELSNRGFIAISPFLVANLLEPASYVSFEAALQHHGMFDQLTSKVISVSLKAHKTVRLNPGEYQFVKTKPDYYFGWQTISIGSGSARVAEPEKALIDMVNYHKSHYMLDLVIEKLRDYQADLDLPRLESYLSRFPETTQRIFGWLFDLVGVNSDGVLKHVHARRGTHWAVPGDPKFNAKWRLYTHPYFDKYKKS